MKILFFARDPGGANVVLPVYMRMKERHNACIYAKDYAFKRLLAEKVPVCNIEEECDTKVFEEVDAFLKATAPDAVITGTSLDDFTERYLWKASKGQGIKAYAIIDQWMNLGIRFSRYGYGQEELYHQQLKHEYLPHKILVMDEWAKKKLLMCGIRDGRIIITGQPYFDTVCQKFEGAQSKYDKSRWNVIFVSEPISWDYDSGKTSELYWGFNEKTIFACLRRNLRKFAESYNKNIRMIIRPHPRECSDNWEDTIAQVQDSKMEIVLDAKSSTFALLKSADLVCGMSSMFLLEAAICRKPIMSILIGLKRENPFILNTLGINKSIYTEEELYGQLEECDLQNKTHINFGFIENASERVAEVVEREMINEKTGC